MKKEKAVQSLGNVGDKIFVKFNKDYIGKLGTFYNGKIYELPKEIYELLKIDCDKVL
jgi:hypothetical protein